MKIKKFFKKKANRVYFVIALFLFSTIGGVIGTELLKGDDMVTTIGELGLSGKIVYNPEYVYLNGEHENVWSEDLQRSLTKQLPEAFHAKCIEAGAEYVVLTLNDLKLVFYDLETNEECKFGETGDMQIYVLSENPDYEFNFEDGSNAIFSVAIFNLIYEVASYNSIYSVNTFVNYQILFELKYQIEYNNDIIFIFKIVPVEEYETGDF